MERLAMCRICFAEDGLMQLVGKTHLRDMYEVLTKRRFETEDSRPIQICYICCARLQNSYQLRMRCLQSEELLTGMLNNNVFSLQEDSKGRGLMTAPVKHLDVGGVCDEVVSELGDFEVKSEELQEHTAMAEDTQHSDVGDDLPLDVMKRRYTRADSSLERDDVESYRVALGLTSECDIPLDVVKEELDGVDSGAPVPETLGAIKESPTSQHVKIGPESKINSEPLSLDTNNELIRVIPYQCAACNEVFTRMYDVDVHKCAYTGAPVSNTSAIEELPTSQHKKIARPDAALSTPKSDSIPLKINCLRMIRYQCAGCRKTFTHKCDFNVHKCNGAPEPLRTIGQLPTSQHESNPTSSNKDTKRILILRHQCSVYRKVFNRLCDLTVHKRTHAVVKKVHTEETKTEKNAQLSAAEGDVSLEVVRRNMSDTHMSPPVPELISLIRGSPTRQPEKIVRPDAGSGPRIDSEPSSANKYTKAIRVLRNREAVCRKTFTNNRCSPVLNVNKRTHHGPPVPELISLIRGSPTSQHEKIVRPDAGSGPRIDSEPSSANKYTKAIRVLRNREAVFRKTFTNARDLNVNKRTHTGLKKVQTISTVTEKNPQHLAAGDVSLQVTTRELSDTRTIHQEESLTENNTQLPAAEHDVSLEVTKRELRDTRTSDDVAIERDSVEPVRVALGLTSECDLPLDVVKEELDGVDFADSALERDDVESYRVALGLTSECDIPLDVVKEELDGEDSDDNEVPPLQKNAQHSAAEGDASLEVPQIELSDTLTSTPVHETLGPIGESPTSQHENSVRPDAASKPQIDSKPSSSDTNKKQKCAVGTDSMCDLNEREHTDEIPNQCNKCMAYFSNKYQLATHLASMHDVELKYQCDVCLKRFSSNGLLEYHRNKHTDGKPYQCYLCSESYENKHTLDIHTGTHIDYKPYQCYICSERYTLETDLYSHSTTHMGYKPFQCEMCMERFAYMVNLDTHYKKSHNYTPYSCDLCTRTFNFNFTFEAHIHKHSIDEPAASYQCFLCDKRFVFKNILDKHINTHGDIPDIPTKPFKCDVCNKCFVLKRNLDTHISEHTDEQPYQCHICDKPFSFSIGLTRHYQFTHPGVSPMYDKSYQCKVCMKPFARKGYLNLHIRGRKACRMGMELINDEG